MNQTLLKKIRDMQLDGSVKLLLIDYLATGIDGKKADEILTAFEEFGLVLKEQEEEANVTLRRQIEQVLKKRDATIARILKRAEASITKRQKSAKQSAKEKRSVMEIKKAIARDNN